MAFTVSYKTAKRSGGFFPCIQAITTYNMNPSRKLV